MAAIDELIEQIENPTLRERISAEVKRLVKQKKFGLVFEEHLPERTLLYEVSRSEREPGSTQRGRQGCISGHRDRRGDGEVLLQGRQGTSGNTYIRAYLRCGIRGTNISISGVVGQRRERPRQQSLAYSYRG